MNDEQLDRNLRSIGKECFVTYFREFCDLTLSKEVAAVIKSEMDYTDKSCNPRTSHARSIIKAGRDRDALIIISKSGRVPASVRDEADRIIATLG